MGELIPALPVLVVHSCSAPAATRNLVEVGSVAEDKFARNAAADTAAHTAADMAVDNIAVTWLRSSPLISPRYQAIE